MPSDGLGGALHADSFGGRQSTGDSIPCDDATGGSRTLFAPGSLARRDVRYTDSSNVYGTQHLGVYPSNVPYSTEARVVENVVLVVNTGILSPAVGTRVADAIEAKIRNPT